MVLLEFTLALIFLAICYIISYCSRYNPDKVVPVAKLSKSDYPVVLVIGATSKRGQYVLNLLKDKNINLIAISRREEKWIKIRDKFPNVLWMRGDIRLSHETDDLFAKIKRNYGSIDLIINLSYISGDVECSKVSSLRVKDSVLCKLDQAYDPELISKSHDAGSHGDENPLFTNLLGHIILKDVAKKYHCYKVILVLGNDSVVNELIYKIERENKGRTRFIVMDPSDLSKILDVADEI